jgi:hypothetical protein
MTSWFAMRGFGHASRNRPTKVVRAELDGQRFAQHRSRLLAAVDHRAGTATILEYEERPLTGRCEAWLQDIHDHLGQRDPMRLSILGHRAGNRPPTVLQIDIGPFH